MKTLVLLLILVLLPFSVSVDAGVKFETAETDTVGTILNLRPVAYAVISLHRIECDTSVSAWVGKDGYHEKIESIVCDTVFHIKFENVRTPVYLDTLQWWKLMRILGE